MDWNRNGKWDAADSYIDISNISKKETAAKPTAAPVKPTAATAKAELSAPKAASVF